MTTTQLPDPSARSCNDCPSALHNSALGVPTCTKYGHILGRNGIPDTENLKITQRFAADCPSYGEAASPAPREIERQVAVPDLDINAKMATHFRTPGDEPTSCSGCQWFIPPDVVMDDFGWPAAMCAAKGYLLQQKNYMREAAQCGVGLAGPASKTSMGVTLNSEYETGSDDLGRLAGQARILGEDSIARHRIDPRLYPTDAPVTPENEVECIRAWRRIDDPEGIKLPIYLPIYDGERLIGYDPRTTYGAHKPQIYIDHQQLMYDIAAEWVGLDETPLLIGGAGLGKTELGCFMAYLMDLPFFRISVDKGTEIWHFKGESHLVVDPDTGLQITKFQPGRFVKAIMQPCVVIVDEPNLKSEIYEFMRPVIDNAKQLVIDDAQGLKAERNDKCYLLLAQNPVDDPIYVGTEPLSAADIDRVSPIEVYLPPRDVEKVIIRQHCMLDGYDIDDRMLEVVMKIADDIRSLIKDGSLPIAWGIRANVKVARKTRFYSIEKSYRRALTDGFDTEKREAVLTVVRSVVS